MLELHGWCISGFTRARVSWLLLTLVVVSIFTTPLTQNLWTWDHFLHGGQDFEAGSFLILISFCLVIVLARSCRSVLACTLQSFALGYLAADSPGTRFPLFPSFESELKCPSGDGYSLPLQI